MHKILLENRTKNIIKETESRKKIFRNLKKIRTILVLLDTEDYEDADVFIDHLERMGKRVVSYAYKNKKDEYDYSDTPYIIIDSKKMAKFFDNKLEKVAEEIREIRYDALIDLTIRRVPEIEYLVASADAMLKIGYKKNDWLLYDFTISAPDSNAGHSENLTMREFGKQILHYLSTIKSN